MPTRTLALLARLLGSCGSFPRAVLFLLAFAAACRPPQLHCQLHWQFHVDYKNVSTKGAQVCVALSHDGNFAAVFTPPTVCDEASFQAAFPTDPKSMRINLFPEQKSTKIPYMLGIPGVLSMYDAGDGQVFFTADGVSDLVALDLNASPLQPVFLHTGLQATNLYKQDSVLWISGSKGITTLNLSKQGLSAWESDLQKAPILQGAFGEWNKSAPSADLLVMDPVTGDDLLLTVSPTSLVIDGGDKPLKKAAAQKITVTNPYGKTNPLKFQLKSWCDPSKNSNPQCKPAAEGLTKWSVKSPGGANSCQLGAGPINVATAVITQTGTVADKCVLQVEAAAGKKAYLTFAVNKPKLSEDKSTIDISFCVVEEGNASCQ
jgi:hypothetical protein